MKDVSKILRTKYYEILNGNITLNGANVPVFDSVPFDTDFPYILLSTITQLNEDDKDSFGTETVQTIDIVTGYSNGSYGGASDSDSIANQVKELIKPNKNSNVFDLSPNFTNIISIFERDNTIRENTDTNYIVRRLIDIKHVIQQNA